MAEGTFWLDRGANWYECVTQAITMPRAFSFNTSAFARRRWRRRRRAPPSGTVILLQATWAMGPTTRVFIPL